ncbi:MAG TPA: choice-of-anchor Q domain-containing protein [Acidimicrobiales bacterium]|nr:choice-of-anchor Q domain-containing protein [Acidimicrobiales bacterium]
MANRLRSLAWRAGVVSAVCVVAAAATELAGLAPAAASASAVYVAATGSDAANTCSVEALPCASVTHALSQVSAGGTVYVSGTIDIWDGSADAGDADGITVSENVTIEQEAGGAPAELQGTGSTSAAGSLLTVGGADTVVLDGLTFEDANSNKVHTGGAVSNAAGGTLTIDGCTFLDDESTNTAGQGGGGAIANGNGTGSATLTVEDSSFTDSYSNGDGGAIDNGDWSGTGSATVIDSTFTSNHAYGLGGAIANATDSGTGTLTVEGSTFESNETLVQEGGAIDNGNYGGTGTAIVEDSTFSGNLAAVGGAIAEATTDGGHGTLTIASDTFGPNFGGGGSEISSGLDLGTGGVSGTVYAAGDVFDGTCTGNSGAHSTWTDGGYNASTDATCLGSTPAGTDDAVSAAIGADLGALTDNGGDTSTMLLLFGDPALGSVPSTAGNVTLDGSSYPMCPTTDQRGVDSPAGQACDAGSVQDTPVGQAGSATVYVSQSGSDGGNDCASATSPCASLTHALSEVASNGTVYVSGTIDVWDAAVDAGDADGITVDQSVTIAQDPGGSPAVLDGTGGSGGTTAPGSIVTLDGANTVDLDGISLDDGNSSAADTGGAITNATSGVLTVSDCSFSADSSSDGGAIDNGDDAGIGTLTVEGSTFSDDSAGSDGGAIDNADHDGGGTVTIETSTFSDDSVTSGDGGAIDNGDNLGVGILTIESSTFDDDSAPIGDGGAIDNADGQGTGPAVVEDSTFSDNSSTVGGAIANVTHGGGVGHLTVVADTFAGDSGSSAADELGNGVGDGAGWLYAAGNLFDGSCVNDSSWTDGGYNASTSSSCLGATPPASDAAVAAAIGSDLGSLADNGGPTATMLVLAGDPALGLISASAPAVALNGVDYTVCPTTDQRGVASPSGQACNAGSVQDTPVIVTVSGSQAYGSSSPSFTDTTSPSGVSVGELSCTTVGGGTPIGPGLAVGSYTVDGSSCSGSAAPAYSLSFVGAPGGFAVGAEPVAVTVSGSQAYGSSSPSFSYTTSPSGVSVSGLSCSTVNGGTPISSALASGDYTIGGSSCSGTASSNYTLDFAGAAGGFTVGSSPPVTVPVTVTVSGSQAFGSSTPSFSYTTSPSGVVVSLLSCTTVGGGTPIGPGLATGSYTIDGSSCSGSAGPTYTLSFVGAPGGFAVSAAPPAPPALPALEAVTVVVSGSQVAGSASPGFSYTTIPAGVTVWDLSCWAVTGGGGGGAAGGGGGGAAIGPGLGAGSYTVLGSSCDGSASFATLTFVGATGGFVVGSAAVGATTTAPPVVTLASSQAVASPAQDTVTVSIACRGGPNGGICAGTVRLSVARDSGGGVVHLVLAEGSYSIQVGQGTVLSLQVTDEGRKILPRSDGLAHWRTTASVLLDGGATSHHSVYLEWARTRRATRRG